MKKLALLFFLLSSKLYASSITAHIGPPALGSGGPNPLSIPPTNPLDYEFIYLTDSKKEIVLGITPGIFYGMREEFQKGFYMSFGGGVVINQAGVGPGIYTAFGFEGFCSYACFNAEYKQALGIRKNSLISPYAIRLGATYRF